MRGKGYAERLLQSIKRECLSQFVVFGERHLEYLTHQYDDYYDSIRSHHGLDNKPIGILAMQPPDSGSPKRDEVERDSRLGGLFGIINAKLPKAGWNFQFLESPIIYLRWNEVFAPTNFAILAHFCTGLLAIFSNTDLLLNFLK